MATPTLLFTAMSQGTVANDDQVSKKIAVVFGRLPEQKDMKKILLLLLLVSSTLGKDEIQNELKTWLKSLEKIQQRYSKFFNNFFVPTLHFLLRGLFLMNILA